MTARDPVSGVRLHAFNARWWGAPVGVVTDPTWLTGPPAALAKACAEFAWVEYIDSDPTSQVRRTLQRALRSRREDILDLFESLGIAFKIINGSNVRYKLCETEDHHHHIICKKCGNVVELDFCNISEWSKKVMELTGYQVTDHQLNFYGFCKICKSLQT